MKFIHSLEFRLIAIVLTIFAISNVTLSVVSINGSSASISETVEKLLNAVTDSAAGKVKGETEKHFRMLNAVAKSDFLKDSEISLYDKCQQLTRIAKVSDEYENIGFYDLNGNSYTAAGKAIQLNRPYIEAAKLGQTYITDPAVNPVTNILFQIYSVPVYDNNEKPIGCLVANVFGEMLSKRIEQVSFGTFDSHLQVVSRKSGHTVASTVFDEVTSSQTVEGDAGAEIKPILEKMLNGEVGSDVFVNPANNAKMLAAYRPVPGTDWAILGACGYSDFYGGMTRMRFIISAFSIVMLVLAFIAVGATVNLGLKPLKNVRNAISDVASGDADLTKRIKTRGKDEVAAVVVGFNTFIDKLHSIISQVKSSKEKLGVAGSDLAASTDDTSTSISQILSNIESVHEQITSQSNSVHETAGAVNQIASNIESLERMIEKQSSGVSEASAAVEEMIGNISSVNNSMNKMSISFEELSESAQAGSQVQLDVNEKIERIKVLSETLQEANTAIAAIAEQTNLLAMNAAIEAAHAGEAGKGFSVVADEIRKLSETSGEQSRTIGDQLTNIQNSIVSVVSASEQSNKAFHDVTSKIKETDQLVRQIQAAMEEQNEGSQQINAVLHTMNDSSLEVRNAGQEMMAGNRAILEEVKNLQDVTGLIQDSMKEMSVGATKINETGEALRGISEQMKLAIDEIGSQIDKFRT
jgi:methyl-accepting chemotaxis protein